MRSACEINILIFARAVSEASAAASAAAASDYAVSPVQTVPSTCVWFQAAPYSLVSTPHPGQGIVIPDRLTGCAPRDLPWGLCLRHAPSTPLPPAAQFSLDREHTNRIVFVPEQVRSSRPTGPAPCIRSLHSSHHVSADVSQLVCACVGAMLDVARQSNLNPPPAHMHANGLLDAGWSPGAWLAGPG